MKATFTIVTFLLGFIAWTGCEQAPKTIPLSAEDIKTASAFFGGNTHFTATRVSTQVDVGAPDSISFTNRETIAFANGNRRQEESDEEMKMIQIIRPDQKTVYILWPDDKVSLVLNMEKLKGVDALMMPANKMLAEFPVKEKTELGEESLNGQRCMKCKVITEEDGEKTEWTTWEAIGLNRFPIRAEHSLDFPGSTSSNAPSTNIYRMDFVDVKIGPPDTALFEPPRGYKKFTSMEKALMYVIEQKVKDIKLEPAK